MMGATSFQESLTSFSWGKSPSPLSQQPSTKRQAGGGHKEINKCSAWARQPAVGESGVKLGESIYHECGGGSCSDCSAE
jgi:ferredoxin